MNTQPLENKLNELTDKIKSRKMYWLTIIKISSEKV